jgi:hypothetical protein
MKENSPPLCVIDVEIVACATKLRKRQYHRYENRTVSKNGGPPGRMRLSVKEQIRSARW